VQFKISLRASSSSYNYQKDNKNKNDDFAGGVSSLYLKRNKLIKEALPIKLIFKILSSENSLRTLSNFIVVPKVYFFYFEKVMIA